MLLYIYLCARYLAERYVLLAIVFFFCLFLFLFGFSLIKERTSLFPGVEGKPHPQMRLFFLLLLLFSEFSLPSIHSAAQHSRVTVLIYILYLSEEPPLSRRSSCCLLSGVCIRPCLFPFLLKQEKAEKLKKVL